MYYLWKQGYYVQRAYASKGVFDVLAIPPKGGLGKALLIQAKGDKKQGYVGPEERARLGCARKKYDGLVKSMMASAVLHSGIKTKDLNGD